MTPRAAQMAGVVGVALLLAGSPATGQWQAPADPPQPAPQMSMITRGLMQVAIETSFFILIADDIGLDPDQIAALERQYFEFQSRRAEIHADIEVLNAEVNRLLTRQPVDIDEVGEKIREASRVNAASQILTIESTLHVIRVLTHEQHMRIVSLFGQPPLPTDPALQ